MYSIFFCLLFIGLSLSTVFTDFICCINKNLIVLFGQLNVIDLKFFKIVKIKTCIEKDICAKHKVVFCCQDRIRFM